MTYSAFKQKLKPLPVFSTGMLGALTSQPKTLKVQISRWKKKGLVQSIRKGLYVLNAQDRQTEPSSFYLANQIFVPSYVSLESALAYYGLIPEFIAATTSVTTRKTCRFANDFGIFTYQRVLPKAFSGFETTGRPGSLSVLLATPEKAVVDFFYLNLSKFSVSDPAIFGGSYRFQNCKILKTAKLRKYAEHFGEKKLFLIVNLFIKEMI